MCGHGRATWQFSVCRKLLRGIELSHLSGIPHVVRDDLQARVALHRVENRARILS
jgi:hypothetical protein